MIASNAIRFLAGLLLATHVAAAEFAMPGGPLPGGLPEMTALLRKDPYDMELLVSFGTSKGGSAGHLALAIREPGQGDDIVHSANFYADRAKEHEKGFYTAELMARIPKMEYLYGTTSSLGGDAAFGLDFGEVYKRSVIGVRVYGVPATEKQHLVDFFARINDDYGKRAPRTEYHDEEVKYDYMGLNCAKTVGAAFRYGAGYKDLELKEARLLPALTRAVAAVNANIPTEMTVKLLEQWHRRGYTMDVVFYRKYPGSAYVDPHDEEKIAFKDLPNRFPSVLSFDFQRDQGHYEDYDNLYAMYVLYNMGKYSVRIDPGTKRLEIERTEVPDPYQMAAEDARKYAAADSKSFFMRLPFVARGVGYTDEAREGPQKFIQ